MATGLDVATLAIRVDGSELGRAGKQLEDFSASGEKAERSARNLGRTVSQDMKREFLAAQQGIQRSVDQLDRIFEREAAEIKVALAQGFITPKEADKLARDAAQAYNQRLASAISARSAAFNKDLKGGTELLSQMSNKFKDVGAEGRRAGLGLGRLNDALVTVARQTTGMNSITGKLVDTVGTFAIGTAYMIPVLAGLAAIGAAWAKLTEDSRKFREEVDNARQALRALAEDQALGIIGQVGQQVATLLQERARIQARIQELQARDRANTNPNVVGNRERIRVERENLAELNEEIEAGLRQIFDTTKREQERINRERERAIDERRRQAQEELSIEEDLTRRLAAAFGDRYTNAVRSANQRGRERRLLGPAGDFFDLGFDIAPLQNIPETINRITTDVAAWDEETQELTLSVNALARDALRTASAETDGMTRAVFDLGAAIAAGGVAGGIAAGLGLLTSAITDLLGGNDRAVENARRIKEAVEQWDRAFSDFADSISGMDPYAEALARNAEKAEDAFDLLNAAFGGITGLDNLPDRQTVVDTLQALAGMDGALAEEARQFWERVLQIIDRAAAEAERIKEAMEKAADAARVSAARDEEELRKREKGGVFDRIGQRSIDLFGLDDATLNGMFGGAGGLGVADYIRDLFGDGLLPPEIASDLARDVNAVWELFKNGTISGVEAARAWEEIWKQATKATDDYAEATKAAAEAAAEAARAEEFRAQVDLQNLELRRLVALGLDEEAFLLRQKLELEQALFEKRSAEYLALLELVQAEEYAAWQRQRNAQATREQARDLEESTKRIDGFARALNGPAGLILALRRYQTVLGAGAPNALGLRTGATGGNTININIDGAGKSPSDIANAVVAAIRRTERAGGGNPVVSVLP